MGKGLFLLICIVCWFASLVAAQEGSGQTAGDEPSGRNGLAVDMVPVPYDIFSHLRAPPPPQLQQTSYPSNLESVEKSLLRAIALKWILDYVNSLTTTTASTTVSTPSVTPSTAPPTTANPCDSWPSANTCRYQIFNEKLTWNAAKAKCPTMCGSVLAHQNIRTTVQIAAVVNAVSFPPTATAWVDLSDLDSFGATHPARWNEATAAAQVFVSGDYATLQGTPGCGYHGLGLANDFRFQQCSGTSTSTPAYYICEVC